MNRKGVKHQLKLVSANPIIDWLKKVPRNWQEEMPSKILEAEEKNLKMLLNYPCRARILWPASPSPSWVVEIVLLPSIVSWQIGKAAYPNSHTTATCSRICSPNHYLLSTHRQSPPFAPKKKKIKKTTRWHKITNIIVEIDSKNKVLERPK